jgi:hypothetical protein
MQVDDQRELEELDQRLRVLLPETYQDSDEQLEPVAMRSAGLKYGADGKVAWDQIWGSFCDLAMAGGPGSATRTVIRHFFSTFRLFRYESGVEHHEGRLGERVLIRRSIRSCTRQEVCRRLARPLFARRVCALRHRL